MAKQKQARKKTYLDIEGFDFSDKKQAFMKLFSMQDTDTRNSILEDLPAYNAMLSLEAESFEELALKQMAKGHGETSNKYQAVRPTCPICSSTEKVTKKTGYIYRCADCGKSFTVNYNSISSGTRCDALTWMKIIHGMLNFKTINEICELCHIDKKTFYKLRNRLFYALYLLMEEVKLYGVIEVDNTFVRVSYKGMSLQAHDYPEDSVFEDATYLSRPPRERGGAYSLVDKNANYICVFTGVDEFGHVLARFAGIGMATSRSLLNRVPAGKFLQVVPQEDPFLEIQKKRQTKAKRKAGEGSLMVSDKEIAIEKYAKSLGIDHEAHVFRKDGVQLKLAAGAHDIQHVNALHKRLKEFLQKTGYVSSKYLPGYLLLFEFIENTGSSTAAVNKLFQILATPNLGKPATYYQDLFAVPNYLLEWFEDDNALKKIPYNKLLAFYLYDHMRNPEKYPGVKMTMGYIQEETSYTGPSIRKIYREFLNAGYREKILKYFGEPGDENSKKDNKKGVAAKKERRFKRPDRGFSQQERIALSVKSINPTVLAIYDEYVQNRQLPPDKRLTFAVFLEGKNRLYGTDYKRTNMLAKFKAIEELGIRDPMPAFNRKIDPQTDSRTQTKLKCAEEYEAIKRSCRERGMSAPKKDEILSMMAEEHGLSPFTIGQYIVEGKRIMRDLSPKGNST